MNPDWPEERADVIGQNGNDGLHYNLMRKHYKLVYEPHWTDNGCDCCEPTEWSYFKVMHMDGEPMDGRTYLSEEDALKAILEHHRIDVEIDYGTD